MRNKIIKKSVSIFMLLIILLSSISNIVLAETEINEAYIEDKGDCGLHLQYWKESAGVWSYIVCHYVSYNKDGKEYPAYCLQQDLHGVGDTDNYSVDIETVLDDVRVWRTIINSYPYKSPQELGLDNEYDAFVATKQAVYCVIYDWNPYTRYRGGDDRGNAIANCICQLVEIGRNGTQTPYSDGINIEKVGDLKEDGDYYSQEYRPICGVDTENYTITATSGLPNGTIITDLSNNEKTTFSGGENFKIRIPKSGLTNNINSIFSIKAKAKIYPIFYGKTRIAGTQDYALTYDPYSFISGTGKLNIQANTGKIVINKTDDETSEPVSGVTFQLTKEDGTIVANATTNENGVATFSGLYQSKYILKEIATDEKYVLNNKEFDVDVTYNGTTTIDVENEHKKGNLKIYKVDKDNNKIALGNVTFDLFSEEFNKIVGTYQTNVDGEIYIENLRIGNYKLIETETNKWYNLAEDTEIKIEWDSITNTTIENELKKAQVKVIKVDKDNNEIKLEGVTFEVLDENNNVLERIITDKNGEALTSKYPVRDFEKLTIREVETLANYVLTEEPQTVVLTQDQITDLQFKNEKIKGYISITKYSSDNNKYSELAKGTKLEGAEFEIYDSENNLVDTVITDETGVATSKELLKGNYTIKEITAPLYYVVNENTFETEIVNHQETVNVDITDDNVDIEVEVEKTGFIETQSEDEIYYDFKNIKNNSNVYLDTFNWQDSLPTNALRLEKIFTGTWNQDLTYSVWYKTNKDDYKMIKENLDTNTNYEIDFTNLELEDDEYVTEYEFRFGKVDIGFMEVETPRIYCKVLQDLPNGFQFTNTTKVYGTYFEKYTEDEDNWTTVVYDKDIQLNPILPKTGV